MLAIGGYSGSVHTDTVLCSSGHIRITHVVLMAQKPTLTVLYLVQIRYICVLRHKSHTKLNGTPGARVCIAFSTYMLYRCCVVFSTHCAFDVLYLAYFGTR